MNFLRATRTSPTVRTLAPPAARALASLVAAVVAATALAGCAPLLVGGAVIGSGLVATDRRTAGIQVEDEAIELKAASRIRDLATLGHVNVTSYNRTVLITGEVPDLAEKARVSSAPSPRVENVRSVVNELGIGGNATLGSTHAPTRCSAPRSRPRWSTPRTCRRRRSRW